MDDGSESIAIVYIFLIGLVFFFVVSSFGNDYFLFCMNGAFAISVVGLVGIFAGLIIRAIIDWSDDNE